MNIVVDTNVVVAAIRSRTGASHAILQKVRRSDGLRLHLSAPVVLEYEEVLLREVVPRLASLQEVGTLLDDLVAVSICHAKIDLWRPLSVDPDDDSLLELASTADADCIVTFNKGHLRPAERRERRAEGGERRAKRELLQKLPA